LDAVRRNVPMARETFDLGMCGAPYAVKPDLAFYRSLYQSEEELAEWGIDLEVLVREGAELFERQFGYRALSAIAPNYCWTDQVEAVWVQTGIRHIQGALFQLYPIGKQIVRRPHYLGERSTMGGMYLIRNCIFDPAYDTTGNLERCLRQVAWAFRFGKPAVIISHRMNYMGSINPERRSRNLGLLTELLSGILRCWPDARFMNTLELASLIEEGSTSPGQTAVWRSAETNREAAE
jgi:hypothetical protein